MQTELHLAVIGAGPVGLALALLAAQRLPRARVTLFDARPIDAPPGPDARTLALSLGSVQLLQRLGAWPGAQAQPILQVHVSQAPPTWADAAVLIDAAEQGVNQLGAVVGYGTLVQALQRAWMAAAEQHRHRLFTRFGHAVSALKPHPDAVEVDAGIAERFDLAVLAEGGVFDDQSPKDLRRDYAQVAWVGTATLARAHHAAAFERFTRQGPLAMLPLQGTPESPHRAALVWCTAAHDDAVRGLDDTQRLSLLNTLLPAPAPQVVALSPLARFALGLNARRSVVDGRIVHIGNAAQTLHPVAGQGLNLGLRDAFSLVDELHQANGIDGALARVNWARGADRLAMMATTDLLARSFAWQWPALAQLRGAALAGVQRAAPLKRLLARHLMFGLR